VKQAKTMMMDVHHAEAEALERWLLACLTWRLKAVVATAKTTTTTWSKREEGEEEIFSFHFAQNIITNECDGGVTLDNWYSEKYLLDLMVELKDDLEIAKLYLKQGEDIAIARWECPMGSKGFWEAHNDFPGNLEPYSPLNNLSRKVLELSP
jgi:hypothetical protein